ncbi:DUF4870 domain-containing protein [Flavobacterium sp. XGLA_31]|uniref:DUF4870 domain-containing protein n=1 Tax=Flavobacterium sp. XGLA_31 TaxID=3447666 RepID=UPI003F3C72C7
MTTTNEKNTATLLHLSTLTQYIIPLGNYIFPVLIWSAKKNDSEYVDQNGKNVLNFQLSILIYSIILCLIAIPILVYTLFKNGPFHTEIHNDELLFKSFCNGELSGVAVLGIVAVLIFFFIKVIEFILIIHAAVKASNGESYKYPLSIPFFK